MFLTKICTKAKQKIINFYFKMRFLKRLTFKRGNYQMKTRKVV